MLRFSAFCIEAGMAATRKEKKLIEEQYRARRDGKVVSVEVHLLSSLLK